MSAFNQIINERSLDILSEIDRQIEGLKNLNFTPKFIIISAHDYSKLLFYFAPLLSDKKCQAPSQYRGLEFVINPMAVHKAVVVCAAAEQLAYSF